MDCVECNLPILEYKQYIQSSPDLCEYCFISLCGADDEVAMEQDIAILTRDQGQHSLR